VDLRRERHDAPVARALTDALEAELLGRYDGVAGSGDPPASDFQPPDGAFLVGWEDGEPVACGGDDERSLCFEKRLG